jgi:hypothetical protein
METDIMAGVYRRYPATHSGRVRDVILLCVRGAPSCALTNSSRVLCISNLRGTAPRDEDVDRTGACIPSNYTRQKRIRVISQR